MRDIREFPVPRGSVAFWWLGQNGFIFKSHEGTVVGTDLYLTNSCANAAPPGMDMSRMAPVLIPPEEVDGTPSKTLAIEVAEEEDDVDVEEEGGDTDVEEQPQPDDRDRDRDRDPNLN